MEMECSCLVRVWFLVWFLGWLNHPSRCFHRPKSFAALTLRAEHGRIFVRPRLIWLSIRPFAP